MTARIAFEDHSKLIDSFARRVLRRAISAGTRAVTFDDIRQELCIAWCVARDNWRPELSVPFVAYLRNGMKFHINRWLDGEIEQSHEAPKSIDDASDEDDRPEIAIPDQTLVPADVALMEKQSWAAVTERVTARTRKFLELLENPPPELMAELRGIEQRSAFARDRGVVFNGANYLRAHLIFDLMGMSRTERSHVRAEIDHAIKAIHRS